MQLRPITEAELPEDFLTRSRFELKFSDATEMLRRTTHFYSMEGDTDYGVLGLIQPTFLSNKAVVWMQWYAGAKHTLSDWRASKNLFTDLSQELNLTFWADVKEDDITSLKFAKHFGMAEVARVDNFIILKGIN